MPIKKISKTTLDIVKYCLEKKIFCYRFGGKNEGYFFPFPGLAFGLVWKTKMMECYSFCDLECH